MAKKVILVGSGPFTEEYVKELHGDKSTIMPHLNWITSNYPAVAAVKDEKLIGYLTGIVIAQFKGSDIGVYCPEWGHATVSENSREIYIRMRTLE